MQLERHEGVKRVVCLLCDAKFYWEYDLQGPHINSSWEEKESMGKSWTKEKAHSIITLRIYRCTYAIFFQMTKNHQLVESVHILYLNYF